MAGPVVVGADGGVLSLSLICGANLAIPPLRLT